MSAAYDRSWTLAADPAEVPRIRREVHRWVEGLGGMPPERLPELDLVVTEMVTNALLHGYRDGAGRPITVAVHVNGLVQVTVTDEGVGMSPHPDSPGAGLGLSIVGNLADALEIVTREDGGTVVRARFDA